MMFKEILREDIGALFFDLDEFAEMHEINGRQMCVVLDSNELLERESGNRIGRYQDGLYRAQLLLYVKAEEYGARPKVGSMLYLDGKPYRVSEAVDEGGVYSITLEVSRA